jgi:hypothetical protein
MYGVTGGGEMIARKQSALVGLRVRFREPLRKKLEVAAKKRGVSLNAELVDRLERSFLAEAVEQVLGSKVEQVLGSKIDRMFDVARAIARGEVEAPSTREEWEHAKKLVELREQFGTDNERVRGRFEKERQSKYRLPKGDE